MCIRDRWGLLSRGSESSREEYRRELEDTVQALRCHPCVGCWVPFNEGWGQYDAAGAVQAIRALDDTRLVDEASGWYDQGGGDVYSLHLSLIHISDVCARPGASGVCNVHGCGHRRPAVAGVRGGDGDVYKRQVLCVDGGMAM